MMLDTATVLPVLQMILAFCNIIIIGYGGYKFLNKPHDTLEQQVKELEKKVADLREVSQKYEHVIFAIGYCVEEDFTKAREALKRADEKMYEDKKLFYDTHPDFKKRLS